MSDDHRFEPAILHIHGQRFPQDPVEVFGTKPGLERLINALIEAVNVGPARCEFLVRDGFEAQARIVCLDGPRREEDWRRSGSPYLEVDDPLVARIIDLTEENARLRQTLSLLRNRRPSTQSAETRGGGLSDGPCTQA